jgi:lysophospholipase L1-like esterase
MALLAVSGVVVGFGQASGASARHPGSAPGPGRTGAWVSTWAAAPQAATFASEFPHGLADQTVRNIILTSVGGTAVRVQLSNTFGDRRLRIGGVAVGRAGPGARLDRAGRALLTFDGHHAVVIAPGHQVLSDPVRFTVRPHERLAVSVFLPRPTGRPTLHGVARQVNYLAAGDHALDASPVAFGTTTSSWYFVDSVNVLDTRPGAATIVTFGDSLTDGVGSAMGANARWPNYLARRLDARSASRPAVVDEGIGGNRVLTSSSYYGSAAIDRFRRDALDRPGVRAVIVLEGINDIGMSDSMARSSAPHVAVSVAQIIAGDRRLIAEAHARGVKILGGTLLPFQGSRNCTPAGETKREALNRWIRTGRAFDGVLDFARVLADPLDPLRLNPAYDSGDHLHPNDAGYRAMAAAVNLRMLLAAG